MLWWHERSKLPGILSRLGRCKELRWESIEWINLAQERDQCLLSWAWLQISGCRTTCAVPCRTMHLQLLMADSALTSLLIARRTNVNSILFVINFCLLATFTKTEREQKMMWWAFLLLIERSRFKGRLYCLNVSYFSSVLHKEIPRW